MALTAQQKRDQLRAALQLAIGTLMQIGDQVKAGRQANAILPAIDTTIGALSKTLDTTKPRSQMTKEERERSKAAKRFEKRNAKMVSWLKLDGIKKGGHGIVKADGRKVEFLSDPASTPAGIEIAVRFGDGTTNAHADALMFRPDFQAIMAPDLSRATVSKSHGKGKGAAA